MPEGKMTEREKLQFHYEIEKELARRIRCSTREDRKGITLAAYRELYEKIPWHISRNKSMAVQELEDRYYADYLRPLVRPTFKVLELGCGSGRALNGLSDCIQEGIGIDATLAKVNTPLHPNISLIEDDVRSISLGVKNFDLIFSLHLIEHLHPDDLGIHLQSVFEHLVSRGTIFMITPHALTGPHDISRGFDDIATGFHLKEYSYAELSKALTLAGFLNIRSQILPRALFTAHAHLYRMGVRSAKVPMVMERTLGLIPTRNLRQFICRYARLVNIVIYAMKP